MAQLKDSLITGSLRVTDTIYTSILQASNTINGLTLTPAATGFTIAGGTTSKTLTVAGTATINAPTQWGIVYGGASGAYTSTAAGTSGQYLKSNGSAAPTWATFSASTVGLGNVENTKLSTWAGSSNITTLGTISTGNWNATAIGATKGGTGQTAYTIGDILYCSAANTLSKLGGNTTTTRKFLRSVATTSGTAVAPAWDTVTKTDVGLSNVENTKLSTWAGSANITTVGTLSSGSIPWSLITNVPNLSNGNGRVFYGTSNTAAATAAKVVTCTAYDALTTGDVVIVKFDNANTASSPTLNVNSKGAKNIKKLYNGAINNLTANGEVIGTCMFIYDGSQWILSNADYNNTYSSQAAASGGTTVSLVTTGEKYTWNNKSNLAIGTTATTAMAGNTDVTKVKINVANSSTDTSYCVPFATSNWNTMSSQSYVTQALDSNANLLFNPFSGELSVNTLTATSDIHSANGDIYTNNGSIFARRGSNSNNVDIYAENTYNSYAMTYNSNTYYPSLHCCVAVPSNDNGYIGIIVNSYYDNVTNPSNPVYVYSNKWMLYRGNDGEAHTSMKLYGAVWNDYAEFRKTNDKVKPGQCVIDNDDGSITITSSRLMPGAQVVTDTFGFAIGKTDSTKTPLAVSGRVLVYTSRPREEYHAGMAVCSAPNGTIDIMTREEIQKYPDCIIGIVSEIPDYEIWGEDNISVNNRIWIKIK